MKIYSKNFPIKNFSQSSQSSILNLNDTKINVLEFHVLLASDSKIAILNTHPVTERSKK